MLAYYLELALRSVKSSRGLTALMLALPGIRWMRRRKQLKAQADAAAA